MIDLFADGISNIVIARVLEQCLKYDGNKYLFQSKNPGRFEELFYGIPKNSILATTIETNRSYKEMGNVAPIALNRAISMMRLSASIRTMVTVEPIMDFELDGLFPMIKMCNPEWVNIGADSKGHKLPEPSKEKTLALIAELKSAGIDVKLKNNLSRIIGDFPCSE